GVRVFDGGMGTMLIAAGMPIGQCPETFDSEKIRRVHEQYVSAGAEFILTCTFGGSRTTLAKHGLADRTREINCRNAQVARQAAGERAYVVGDIGPTGELLQPYGACTENDAFDAFLEQARGLEEGGVDCFIIETMSDVREMQAATRAVRSVSQKPLIASMTFASTPRGYRTVMGTTVAQAVEAMEAAGADVIGTNCTLAPDEMVGLVAEMARCAHRPILAEPNAGRPHIEGDGVVYPPIENLEKHIEAILDGGARAIGGCCGTNPDYIRLVRRIVDERNRGDGSKISA
ncbi:homocysteine S-methyltransferase family protein, partial [Candidatus Sumerlaeota bacterium]|nr:homocysteine S-methyltransferase family protein [Candidatus Sumerlaeota bacterium]